MSIKQRVRNLERKCGIHDKVLPVVVIVMEGDNEAAAIKLRETELGKTVKECGLILFRINSGKLKPHKGLDDVD